MIPICPIPLAEIPVIDWHGPQFLAFYAVAFIVAMVLSLRRRKSLLSRFEVPGAALSAIRDPFEAAYLAGGTPRAAQVAVIALLSKGALVTRKPSLFRSRALFLGPGVVTAGMDALERDLIQAVRSKGERGLKFSEVAAALGDSMLRVERKFASRGLRPTRSEFSGMRWRAVSPLGLLVLLGLVKFFIGVSRDKPVAFLVILVFMTVIALLIVATGTTERLTPTGRLELERLRNAQPSGSGSEAFHATLPMAVALGGIAVLAGHEASLGLEPNLVRDLNTLGPPPPGGGSGGCGTSGCGSSGGGSSGGDSGGGCGGCGGGGCD